MVSLIEDADIKQHKSGISKMELASDEDEAERTNTTIEGSAVTEEGEDSTDDSDGEEDDDDREPKLKFERIANDLRSIVAKDEISCCAVHSKFLCIGSKRGNIYILDHLGNNVVANPKKYFEAHKIAVNQISIDSGGEFIASCSDDGRVNVYDLCKEELEVRLDLDKQIPCIAIDPSYFKGGFSRRFVIGDDSITLYERNILARLRPTVLLEGGPVHHVSWKDRFIAWSRRGEVRVYDSVDRVTISRIPFVWRNETIENANAWSEHESLKYTCCTFWKDPYTFFIGWGNSVRVCQVKKQDRLKVEQDGVPAYYVQISSMFDTGGIVFGLSSYETQNIVLFGGDKFGKNDNEDSNDLRPKLHVIQPYVKSFSFLCSDVLQVKEYQKVLPTQYHLQSLPEDMLYFIVSPRDVILAKNRDYDDKIQWLISHKKYEEALEFASGHSRSIKRYTFLQVGLEYLDRLMDSKKYVEAAKVCFRVLGPKDYLDKWEEQILKFGRLGQLRIIAPFIPRSENFKLSPYIYEMILFEYLKTDEDAFHRLVREWAPPPELYNVNTIIKAVIDHLLMNDAENHFLLQALADLYSYQRRYGKALAMYLKLCDPHVFQLIMKYNLFEELGKYVEELMELRLEDSLQLLMKYRDRVEPHQIVEKLQNNRYFLYMYLESLYEATGKEMDAKFHEEMVHLRADFAPKNLLQFLRASDLYSMSNAFAVCKKRKMYPEMIFLLGRMGNAREALRLITHELKDIQAAIDFCKEHDDRDLWEDLINFSIDSPDHIHSLLNNIGTHINPEILIRKIRNGLEIPDLKRSLVKIMQDYSLQFALQEGCKNIVVHDCLVLFQKQVKTQLRGVYVEDDQECGTCHKRITNRDFHTADDIKVFYCKHVFHVACLSSLDDQNCVICNLPRKGASYLDQL